FISKEKYEELIKYFKENGELKAEDEQETHYFSGDEDLRIQKNKFYSKIWLKKGKIHDEAREEIEIKSNKEDFDKMEKLFEVLGYDTEIKWFRNRKEFDWNGIKISLDYTKGYGYIIELEKMVSDDKKEKALEDLKVRLKELGIELTSREKFDETYKNYKENWKSLIEESDRENQNG
ncbi:MAG: CYTH domain-containing protein, partial [Nanoarchaeota archaeon]|nr:CYTH domain-containing protein [Nanoarchaeota archaeon]